MTDNQGARVTRSKARWIDSGCRLMSVWAPVITLAQRHSDPDREAIARGYRNYYASRSAASAQLRRYMNRMPISMGLDAAINHYARFIETGIVKFTHDKEFFGEGKRFEPMGTDESNDNKRLRLVAALSLHLSIMDNWIKMYDLLLSEEMITVVIVDAICDKPAELGNPHLRSMLGLCPAVLDFVNYAAKHPHNVPPSSMMPRMTVGHACGGYVATNIVPATNTTRTRAFLITP